MEDLIFYNPTNVFMCLFAIDIPSWLSIVQFFFSLHTLIELFVFLLLTLECFLRILDTVICWICDLKMLIPYPWLIFS